MVRPALRCVPGLAGGFLLLGSVAAGLLAGLVQCLRHLGKDCGVLAVPLAAELVGVRALPVGALEHLGQQGLLLLDFVRTSLKLGAQVLQLRNVCTPNSH